MFSLSLLTATAVFASSALAQLSGTVGPLTTSAQKAAVKVCNILDYGGVASLDTDNGPAIASAWSALYIPAGDYGFATWLTLKHGNGVSINIEGTLYRTSTAGGNMIFIRDSTDVEIYSATASGAIQAYGYEFHKDGSYGARILRLYHTTNFSIHDLALVDAPQFHLTLDTCTSGEVYNVVIHGGYKGGLDGIDVSGSNIWIHDVEVSNKDECVTVKNPSDHLLIENVHCNWSGGCAMGSLSTGTDIHDIEYRNIYTHHSNQMYMFKSNGGNGSVYNVALNSFSGHSNAYTFDMDTAWAQQSVGAGDGISYHDITLDGWSGTCSNGVQRGPIKVLCPAAEPCYNLAFTDFNIWTETGSKEYYVCANAYGTGGCLDGSADHEAAVATKTQTITAATDYAYSTMANELTAGFDVSSPIPVPTIPASFYPGIAPFSAILSGSVAKKSQAAAVAASSAAPATTTSSVVSTATSAPAAASTSLAAAASSSAVAPAAATSSSAVAPVVATATVSVVVAAASTPASASSASVVSSASVSPVSVASASVSTVSVASTSVPTASVSPASVASTSVASTGFSAAPSTSAISSTVSPTATPAPATSVSVPAPASTFVTQTRTPYPESHWEGCPAKAPHY